MIDAEVEARRIMQASGVDEPLMTRRPNPLPAVWGRIFRVGGSSLAIPVAERVQLGLEGYALTEDGNPDRATALALLNSMRLALLRVDIDHPHTFGLFRPVEYGSVANLPDPDSDHARFTTAIELRAAF